MLFPWDKNLHLNWYACKIFRLINSICWVWCHTQGFVWTVLLNWLDMSIPRARRWRVIVVGLCVCFCKGWFNLWLVWCRGLHLDWDIVLPRNGPLNFKDLAYSILYQCDAPGTRYIKCAGCTCKHCRMSGNLRSSLESWNWNLKCFCWLCHDRFRPITKMSYRI